MRCCTSLLLLAAGLLPAADPATPPDFTKEKVLYVVPYAHLDTQWRWSYILTIDKFIKDTIDANLARFRTIPGNVFTFTGSIRFEMMKEYYPEGYAQVKELIKDGRWHVGGSSVDENDANVPSPESLVRQILYGNRWFRQEFGKDSIDYMLPDCFGFPAHLPSVFAHCGLRGFSTQKLSWGYPYRIPFSVGVWEGPDGKGVISALDCTDYTGRVGKRIDIDPKWIGRVDKVAKASGYAVDYRYFGVGDKGGAPREDDIKQALAAIGNPDSVLRVILSGSDQMFRDLPKDAEQKLPKFRGELLLREHSCGSLTSQAMMKRWNRKAEQLADAAERAAALADWLGAVPYPRARIEEAWWRVLGSQMHDILPGTSIPKAYDLSWNDEVVALNLFAGALEHAAAGVAKGLDTRVQGVPLVVYNPLAAAREDVVEASVVFPAAAPEAVSVWDGERELPAQVLERDGARARIAILLPAAPVSWTVLDVRPGAAKPSGGLRAGPDGIENAAYRVRLDAAGDVVSIIDKQHGDRELLAGPAQLQFQYHKPRDYPAWNMDWNDQQKPPMGVVDGKPEIRVIEQGPVRVALEVRRAARDSVFVQRIRLAAGDAGRRLEFATSIDWQSQECALKAAFPLTVANKEATYNLGLGTSVRPTNHKDQYEVPHREWFDLTAADGSYGVSVLEDSRFGSDKPSDSQVRLTLLYTPGVRGRFKDQATQDWGRHEVTYALYGHRGDWRNGSEWQGRRLNQPLIAFQTGAHPGPLGRRLSFLSVSSPQVDVRACKRAEEGDGLIVRLQELHGMPADRVTLAFAAPVAEAWEVDGQERRIGPATIEGGKVVVSFGAWSPKSVAVRLAPPAAPVPAPTSLPVALTFDTDAVSGNAARAEGDMAGGLSYPAEQFPAEVVWNGVRLVLGPVAPGAANALACRGQQIALPAGDHDRVILLAAASERLEVPFAVGGTTTRMTVPAWTGFIGQADNRIWDRPMREDDYEGSGRVTGLAAGWIHREPVAWYAHHRHSPTRDEAYRFAYLFARELPLAGGSRTLTLPDEPRVKIFALSLAKTGDPGTVPAQPLYDELPVRGPLELRAKGSAGLAGDREARGMVAIDCKDAWEKLSMGAPSASDAADRAGRLKAVVRAVKGGWANPSNQQDGKLPVLNDGTLAAEARDRKGVVFFDGEGRFVMDLRSAVPLARVNTFSWSMKDRSAQNFSLWASAADTMPDPGFGVGGGEGWTLLGRVDSRSLGLDGRHGSTVMDKDGGPLGPYRWLLWVAEDQGKQGTCFAEIDVHLAE